MRILDEKRWPTCTAGTTKRDSFLPHSPPGTGGPTYIIVWQCSCIVVYGMSVAFSGTDLEPDHHVVLVLKSRWRFNGQSWGWPRWGWAWSLFGPSWTIQSYLVLVLARLDWSETFFLTWVGEVSCAYCMCIESSLMHGPRYWQRAAPEAGHQHMLFNSFLGNRMSERLLRANGMFPACRYLIHVLIDSGWVLMQHRHTQLVILPRHRPAHGFSRTSSPIDATATLNLRGHSLYVVGC